MTDKVALRKGFSQSTTVCFCLIISTFFFVLITALSSGTDMTANTVLSGGASQLLNGFTIRKLNIGYLLLVSPQRSITIKQNAVIRLNPKLVQLDQF